MLLAVVGSLIYSRERKSNEPVSSLVKVWNELEIRVLVIVSLCLQILLIFLGNRRKYIVNPKLHWFLWFIYLSADWIATLALGILSKDTKIDNNFIIMAIWAPFLLLHLGGPDTITAYSLEDNELWKRHLLELLYQLAVALYVVYRSWNGKSLNYVTIPIVLAGIIKYAEKTWSLRSGSTECFRDSILPSPDPGPNYAKFMDDYTAKIAEGYIVNLTKVIEFETAPIVMDCDAVEEADDENINVSDIQNGFKFYNIPECLFADLILSFQDHRSSQHFFKNATWQRAFAVVAVELGLIYDVLYTKAVLTYKRRGIFLKLIRFADTCAEVDELLKERKYISERNQLCKMILRVSTDIPPSQVKGDRSKSVLFDACRLAKSLQSLEKEENGCWSKEKKWGMISRVWVEKLCHAASQCRGRHHAKQLSQGGELLTHVWLLMAHLGITEQFQISEGHARAKLKLE